MNYVIIIIAIIICLTWVLFIESNGFTGNIVKAHDSSDNLTGNWVKIANFSIKNGGIVDISTE